MNPRSKNSPAPIPRKEHSNPHRKTRTSLTLYINHKNDNQLLKNRLEMRHHSRAVFSLARRFEARSSRTIPQGSRQSLSVTCSEPSPGKQVGGDTQARTIRSQEQGGSVLCRQPGKSGKRSPQFSSGLSAGGPLGCSIFSIRLKRTRALLSFSAMAK